LRHHLVDVMVISSAITTACFVGYYQLISALEEGRSRASIVSQNVILANLAIGVLTIVTNRWLARSLQPTWEAVVRGAHTASVRAELARQPVRVARLSMILWLVPTVLSPLDDVARRHFRAAGGEAVGIFLGSLAGAAVVYLLTERAMRPMFRLAFATDPPDGAPALGIRTRLLVAWALGSGVPLAGIAATPLIRTGELPPTFGMVYLAALGLGVGVFMTGAIARSVADPLRVIVTAMGRVETGSLDVSVPTDDAGDIGRVQAGLNRMAQGLQERARLEDLFGRHVGLDVARTAMARGAALGGETCGATILFVDIVGSTEKLSKADPAEAVAVANRFFAEVVAAVTAQRGWVNKFQGDGAMCVFGAPISSSNHVEQGRLAAVGLRRRLIDADIDAALGLATGVVIAGNVGTPERLEYTVMGAPVNRAARLCEEAKRLPSRVAAEFGDHSPDGAWVCMGPIGLRGFADPTIAWQLA
jgi:adenylate cyclase